MSGSFNNPAGSGSGLGYGPNISGKVSQFLGGGVPSTFALAANRIYLVPRLVKRPVTINAIGGRIITAGTTTIGAAIFGNDPTGIPLGFPLGSISSVVDTAIGPFSASLSSPITWQPDTVYWTAVWTDAAVSISGSGPGDSFRIIGDTYANMPASSTAGWNGFSVVSTYSSTWPTMTGATLVPNLGAGPELAYTEA